MQQCLPVDRGICPHRDVEFRAALYTVLELKNPFSAAKNIAPSHDSGRVECSLSVGITSRAGDEWVL